MKALVLGAGYAVNLYPLTENQAKPLISIADKPIIEYMMDKIARASDIDEVYIGIINHYKPFGPPV